MIKNDIEKVLISEQQLSDIIDSLAERITNDYKDSTRKLVFVVILKGSIPFATELMKRITYFVELLEDPEKLRGVLREELLAIRDKFADGRKTVSNRTGSNIVPGCCTNLLNTLNWFGKCCKDAAVYEVDERASRLILPHLKPDYLVVTGLFRDSLKRNAHPDYIFSVIDTYCPDTTKLILNADELCCSMLKKNSDRVFYGIGKQATDLTESINIVADYALCPDCGTKLRYDYLRYHHIGHAVCPNCGFHSQDAKYLVTEINAENKTLTLSVDGQESTYPIINPILFNIYNQLTVTTTLLELGIPQAKVQEIVAKIQVPDSRLNNVEVKGVSVTQAMSKGQSCISSCRTFV